MDTPSTPTDRPTTPTIRLQYLAGHTSRGPYWVDAGDRTESFLADVEATTALTREQVVEQLAAGAELRCGTSWSSLVRCGIVADARRAVTDAALAARQRPRFTCPRCGEHRDTTIRGRCDDCDN